MKKIFTYILLILLTFSVLSCGEDNSSTTTLNTISETTEEETTLDTQAYSELSKKIADFDDEFSYASGLDMFMDTTIDVYIGGDSQSDISTTQTLTMNLITDLIDPYYYIEYSSTGVATEVQIYELVNDDFLVYSLYHDRIQTSIIPKQEQSDSITGMLDEFYIEGEMDRYAPSYIKYFKLSDNYYRTLMSIDQLASLNPEIFNDILSIGGSGLDLSDIFVEINYRFNYLDYDFYLTINMEPFPLTEQGDNYLGMTSSQGIRLLDTVDRIYFNLDYLKVEGAQSRFDGIFTIKEDVDEYLYINWDSNNYFRYYFEEGYYYIDDSNVAYGDIDIELYNSEFYRINGSRVFEIEESDYYYLNFINNTESAFTLSPLIYKLNEETVGLPDNPIVQTDHTITLTANMGDTTYLLDDETESDGLLILKKEGTADTGFIPYYTYDFGRQYQDYYTYIIEEGAILAINFKHVFDVDTTYTWSYIPCGEVTTNYQEMRQYSNINPTFILLNKSNPNTNVSFNVSETKSVNFNYSEGSFYASEVYVNVYSEDGTLIVSDILNKSYTLDAGNYYLEITSTGYSSDIAYNYFILIIS